MADRKLHLGLRTVMFAGSLGIAGGAACFAVESQNGDEISPPPSIHNLRVTPTPTRTPLIFESPLESLRYTVTPTPDTPEEATDLPTAQWTPGQDFTEPPFSTFRPTVAPVPTTTVVTLVPTAEPPPTPETRDRDDIANELFSMINEFRGNNGEFSLSRNGYLDTAANAYAKDYYERGDYINIVHNLGGEPLERVNKVSPADEQWFWVGDVITVGFITAEDVMDFWVNSPPHRAALLSFPNENGYDKRIIKIGLGCFQGPNIRQGQPYGLILVCVGSLGIPGPTPAVTEIQ